MILCSINALTKWVRVAFDGQFMRKLRDTNTVTSSLKPRDKATVLKVFQDNPS